MFQTFTASTRPEDGPPRLRALRIAMAAQGLAGVIVPRADAHQGEYVAACDERLAWLYRLQGRLQCAPEFSIVHWPETKPGEWLRKALPEGGIVGFDPWLHTKDEIDTLEGDLKGSTITLRRIANPIDPLWTNRPAPPMAAAFAHPVALAGLSSADKRAQIARALRDNDQRAAVLTQPESLCWLLNIRGADLPRVPVVQGFGIVHDDGRVDLFARGSKFDGLDLGEGVHLRPRNALEAALRTLSGPVRLDRASAPLHLADTLAEAGIAVAWMQDPCMQPKARKTPAELAGARAAHLRDGVAMAEFLAWLHAQTARPDFHLTEIDLVRHLEACRRATGVLLDLSFDTISGSGPNGAIMHYRVTEDSNRRLQPGELMLVDSGGQYRDGTTDVTRTMALGPVGQLEAECYTRVLQGMIALSRARFPRGVAGGHLDALARYPLWLAGLDYDHGTGHGVGSFLSVHEGPQRLSRISQVPLAEGMILSNEPGYYREGAFGIRLENLVVVQKDTPPPGGEARDWLGFETLTLVPFDRRLIVTGLLTAGERDWLNAYHARVQRAVSDLLTNSARDWLAAACAPI